MSIKVMSEVWEHAPFVGTDLLILLALADMANDDRECWPSIKHVAHKGRITEQQASKVLKNLELQGVITSTHRKVAGKGNISNLYYIKKPVQWDVLIEYDNDNPPHAQDTPLPIDKIPPSHKPTRENVAESSVEPSIEPNTSRKRDNGTIPASRMNPMKDAIVDAFGWDVKTITKATWGVIQTTAKELCEVDFQPENITSLYNWCKGQFKSFSPRALSTNLAEYCIQHPKSEPAPTSMPPVYKPSAKVQQREAEFQEWMKKGQPMSEEEF